MRSEEFTASEAVDDIQSQMDALRAEMDEVRANLPEDKDPKQTDAYARIANEIADLQSLKERYEEIADEHPGEAFVVRELSFPEVQGAKDKLTTRRRQAENSNSMNTSPGQGFYEQKILEIGLKKSPVPADELSFLVGDDLYDRIDEMTTGGNANPEELLGL